MTPRGLPVSTLLVLTIALLVPAGVRGQDATPAADALPDGVTVVASGLTNPRGFTWGADGTLYLALAGTGGPNQVIAEDGTAYPYFGGMTSSIARIEDGCAVPVAEGLASFLWTDPGWIWGAMDVAILDGQLYALLGGGGADVGMPDNPNGVYRVSADGSTEIIADLSAWFRENPPIDTPWDYGADGSLFDLEAGTGRLWVSEAVGGRLLAITPDGQIALVADLSVEHMVPTGVAVAPDGGAYVNHETVVPFPDGAAKVIHVAADGTVTDYWTGLTAGTDLAMGPDSALYAAEMATGNLEEPPYLQPGTGRVVRQTGPDSLEPVVTDIDYPVQVDFGPDGALYLAYPAFAP
ncbi:MAG: ScyD/ScyE family protein, partial [Chloroflexia bacterium]|nr:ScyD/ScyE family protein [Chloroflexia bacterium]